MKIHDDIVQQVQRLAHQIVYHKGLGTKDFYEGLSQEIPEELPPLSIAECHLINCIGSMENINAITIAKRLDITRGGISKMTARLQEKGLIHIEKADGSNKMLCYQLTPLGQKIYDANKKLHKKYEAQLHASLDDCTEAELHAIQKFIMKLQQIV